jgi:hypothetical protein
MHRRTLDSIERRTRGPSARAVREQGFCSVATQVVQIGSTAKRLKVTPQAATLRVSQHTVLRIWHAFEL